MRVAIDFSILEGGCPTGVERYLLSLVRGLAEVGPPGEIRLVVRRPTTLPFPLPDTMRFLLTKGAGMPLALWRETVLVSAITNDRCDIFHSGVTAIPLRGRGFRRIATVYELTWRHYAPIPRKAATVVRVAAASRAADCIVVSSHHTLVDLTALHPRAIDRVKVVYPALDRIFRPLPDRRSVTVIRRRLRMPERPFFLFVGRIEPKKNLESMMQAVARLRGAPSLLLVGPLAYPEDVFARLVDRHGLAGRVFRAGYVTDEDLVALLNEAAALLYVSHMEGFGFPPLEAMACGTPAIVSDRGPLPEVTAGAALVVPADNALALADAMQQVLDDEGLRDRITRAGRKRAAEFTSEAAGHAISGIYQALAPRGW